jgi:hydroxyacylglutathione hydrolase
MVSALPVPAFADNYIWLIRRAGRRQVAVVDPGDAKPVLEALRRESLTPVAVLITHHHGDHTGGIRELLAHHELPVYGPAGERVPALTHPLAEGDEVALEPLAARFTVLDVPGHTAGHIAYYGHNMLFCGDTLFTCGCGRLFEGTPAQMHGSLSKLAALPEDTLVYCGHEYTLDNLRFAQVVEPHSPALQARLAESQRLRMRGEPTVPAPLRLEKETNPFLRSEVPEVIAAAEGFAGRPLGRGAEVFGTLRYWKDTLD